VSKRGAVDLIHERQQAHAYLDRLTPRQLVAVRNLLEAMLGPLSRGVADATEEDELIGADEARTVADARVWLKNNDAIPHRELLAEFDLTPDDFKRMGGTPVRPSEVPSST
jgi:hypothetical protein